MKSDKDISEEYDSFWKQIVENKDGTINLDQLKKELSDYSLLLDNVPKVYMDITNDRISKPFTDISVVISQYEQILEERIADAIEEFLQCPSNERRILSVARKYKINNFLESL